jgi:diguanylate cyclase (GGDEF)-like protein/PAS domain S-box-containing protein
MTDTSFNLGLDGLEILVVEDDPAAALMISHVLSANGAEVEVATDGREGLQKFEQRHVPLIITDINMPDMNGFEMVSRIKAIEQDTMVIATSANRETRSLVAAIELGFSDYLLKPIEIESLLLSVKRCGDAIAVRRQLESEREKFRTVVDCLGEGIAIKDLSYRILYQNRALTQMFGDFTGLACYEMFGHKEPCQNCPTVLAMQDGKTHSACKNNFTNSSILHVESSASLVRDSSGTVTGTVAIVRDVSERIKNEQTIRDMAFKDPLTGLSNRRLFEDRLEQAIAKSRRYNMKFGLFYLDLDYFKKINDTLGHEAGDEVLIGASERIRTCCKRVLDTISRQGGDEFCVIVTDCGGREQLDEVAENLLQAFNTPFTVNGTDVTVTTSIGISIFPDDGEEPKELEAAADKAMYAAKRSGRNACMFYEAHPRL